MADDLNLDVIIRLAVQGARQSKGDLDAVLQTTERLNKQGQVTEKTFDQVSKQYVKYSNALGDGEKKTRQSTESINALRYANYDLATSFFTVSAAITGAGVGLATAFATIESGFSAVERTTGLSGGALAELEDQLVSMADRLPVAATEIQTMAARAGQLGVASDQVDEFTEAISKFAAISDTLTPEEAANSIARIGNLTGTSDWEALASAIALVGVNSAATDAQITKTTQELAQAASATSLTADEVIGLAAAFASLGVPPERARSVIQNLVVVMNKGLAGLNESIPKVANLFGITADEAARLWSQEPDQFISRFAQALSGLEQSQITTVLADIGLEGARAQPVFAALAADARNAGDGVSVLNQALSDSRQGFTEATEVNRQFAIIADDLSSKWQTFLNTALTTAAAVGGALAPAIGDVLAVASDMLIAFREWAESPVGQTTLEIAGRLAALVAAFTAVRGAIALATGSLLAMRFVAAQLGGAGILAGIRGLWTQIRTVGTSASGASGAVAGLTAALRTLGRVVVIGAVFSLLSELVFNFGQTMVNLRGPVHFVIDLVGALQNAMATAAAAITGFLSQIPLIGGAFDAQAAMWSKAARNTDRVVQQWKDGYDSWLETLDTGDDEIEGLSNSMEGLGVAFDDTSDSAGEFGGVLSDVTKEVRTLADYANDLSSVWSRAFEIRFGGQSSFDAITSSFQSIRDAAEESQKKIRDLRLELRTLNADIQGLQSDRAIQQYFLGIANEYGDSARAAAIRANIAKLDAEIAEKRAQVADKTKELSKEQAASSMTLVGNSAAAIKNRDSIRNLVSQYQAHIQALASSGLSQDELRRRTEQLRQDFINQATQLGFNRNELALYEQAFHDVTVAIDNVPRNITVAANVDPALQALNEFEARARAAAQNAANAIATGGGLGYSVPPIALEVEPVFKRLGQPGIKRAQRSTSGHSFATGGYTGRGGTYEPAGIVHKGEYVIPKKYVDQRTGLPQADALGRLTRGVPGRTGYASGGYVSGGGMSMGHIASFGPMAVQQLATALYNRITIDSDSIAQRSSRAYANATALGSA